MSTRGGKLLSLVLAGACGVLFLLALALQLGVGRGYAWLAPEIDTAGINAGHIDSTPFKLPAESEFAATQERPLFNEDRKPSPDEPDDSGAPPAPPPVPLNIALTGIVLTPDVRLAMVQDKAKSNSVALKEGMPMPGDQGGWTLTKINSRSAIFRESSGDEVEVELTTAVANPSASGRPAGGPAAKAPVNPAKGPPPSVAQAGGAPPTKDQNQQDALQQRIEERRKQMRDEAARIKQQNVTPEQMREEARRLQQQDPQKQ
jgi:general secretion pathway protein N